MVLKSMKNKLETFWYKSIKNSNTTLL